MEYVFPIITEFIVQYLYRICFCVKTDKQIFVVAIFDKTIVTCCRKSMMYIFQSGTMLKGGFLTNDLRLHTLLYTISSLKHATAETPFNVRTYIVEQSAAAKKRPSPNTGNRHAAYALRYNELRVLPGVLCDDKRAVLYFCLKILIPGCGSGQMGASARITNKNNIFDFIRYSYPIIAEFCTL
jgi:hypothetical protein